MIPVAPGVRHAERRQAAACPAGIAVYWMRAVGRRSGRPSLATFLLGVQPMRHASFTGSPLAICVTAMLCVAVLAGGVHAAPNPIPAGSKLVYNFNVLGYPAGQTYNGNCGNGHRIFVNREANKAQVLVQNGTSWDVVDCDATADHQAILQSSEPGLYDVYVRILGKPEGHIFICGQLLEDFLAGETLCSLGTIDLTRDAGHSKFQLAPAAMFDATLENLIWTVDTNSNFRIVQFRVYKRP